jgi:hypothetical protein
MSRESDKEKTRIRLWNSAIRMHLSATPMLSRPEICRLANIHKSDMSKFMNHKKLFGKKILVRLEKALEHTGYKTKDPRVKKFKATIEETKIKKAANFFLKDYD